MRALAANLTLAIGSLGVVLLALELGARVAMEPVTVENLTPVPRGLLQGTAVPGLSFRLRPNGVGVHRFPSNPRGYFDDGATLTYRTNALGLRGPEVALEKAPGVVRVLGVGDSFTFGTGVRHEDTYLSVLQRALDARGDVGYEVLNLGLMGLATRNEVRLLEHVGLPLAPDLVVLGFVLNDTGGGKMQKYFNAEIEYPGAGWWGRSRLLHVVAQRLNHRERARQLVADYRRAFAADSKGWIRVQQAFDQARDLARTHQFTLTVAIFPVLWQLSGDYPFAGIHAQVEAAARARGFAVIDLQPALSGFDGPELWVHSNNQHPNEVAHAVAGKALYHFLDEQSLLGRRGEATGRAATSAPTP